MSVERNVHNEVLKLKLELLEEKLNELKSQETILKDRIEHLVHLIQNLHIHIEQLMGDKD